VHGVKEERSLTRQYLSIFDSEAHDSEARDSEACDSEARMINVPGGWMDGPQNDCANGWMLDGWLITSYSCSKALLLLIPVPCSWRLISTAKNNAEKPYRVVTTRCSMFIGPRELNDRVRVCMMSNIKNSAEIRTSVKPLRPAGDGPASAHRPFIPQKRRQVCSLIVITPTRRHWDPHSDMLWTALHGRKGLSG
jgi:hypothetical protein